MSYLKRINEMKKIMIKRNIDAIVLWLPENILSFTGHWPITAPSTLVITANSEPVLIVPESEYEYAVNYSSVKYIRKYPLENLKNLWNPLSEIRKALADIELKKEPIIGVELSQNKSSITNVVIELSYPSKINFELLKNIWKNPKIVDITNIIYDARKVKIEEEIKRIKIASKLTAMALEETREFLKDGIRENELASIFEKKVQSEGIGFMGIKRARGFAFVMSGSNTSRAWYPFNISTNKRIRNGDVILLELNVYAEGYWADVTRTWYLGSPTQEIKDMHEALIAAQDEVYRKFREGLKACEVDMLARRVIKDKGFGDLFPHRLGHGVGARLHELPDIHPASNEVLIAGMVHTVEPGLYTKKFGLRLEDVILDMNIGITNLTQIPKDL